SRALRRPGSSGLRPRARLSPCQVSFGSEQERQEGLEPLERQLATELARGNVPILREAVVLVLDPEARVVEDVVVRPQTPVLHRRVAALRLYLYIEEVAVEHEPLRRPGVEVAAERARDRAHARRMVEGLPRAGGGLDPGVEPEIADADRR